MIELRPTDAVYQELDEFFNEYSRSFDAKEWDAAS